jgi:aminoglycoside phosphotransferase (APT) family kinase protein
VTASEGWGRPPGVPERPASAARPSLASVDTASTGETGQQSANGFGPDSTQRILRAACDEAGLDARDAELIRLGENALYRLPHESTVVRIARGPDYQADAEKEVHVSEWLTTQGFPTARLRDVPQPLSVDGHPVTFWRYIDGRPGERSDVGTLGRLLRELHSEPRPTAFDLPSVDTLDKVTGRIGLAPVAADDKQYLLRHCEELKATLRDLDFPLPLSVIHGDAHIKNLMIQSDGNALMIDLERFSYGHPEWDLSVTATEHVTAGWWTRGEYATFTEAYGFDVTEWDGFPVLRATQELKMTTWIMQNVEHSRGIANEFEKRMATIRGGPKQNWTPF